MTTGQRCDDCGTELGARDTAMRCPKCGGLLSLRYDAPAERGQALRARFDARRSTASTVDALKHQTAPLDASGVWRYRELVLPDADAADVVTHPEGNTPLLRRASVAQWCGADALLMKHEGTRCFSMSRTFTTTRPRGVSRLPSCCSRNAKWLATGGATDVA